MAKASRTRTAKGQAQGSPAYLQVADRLREDILSGTWPMGMHVPIVQLVARYEVSPMPIRDALNQLLGEGLVRMEAHKGFTIPEVDEQFLNNLYDLRRAVEAMLTSQAAKVIDAATLARVEDIARRFAENARAGEVGEALKLNRLFHRTINTVAGNPMALSIMDGRTALVYALRRKLGYGPGRIDSIIAEHDTIIAALRAGDSDWAESAARVHCLSAKADVLTFFADDRLPAAVGTQT